MNRIRVAAVETEPITMLNTIFDIEHAINKEIIELEKNGSRVLNLISVKDKGFLILHEEPYPV